MASGSSRQDEERFDLSGGEPELLQSELERVLPLGPETAADPALPSSLRIKLARLSVAETVGLALIATIMCICIIYAVMRFMYASPAGGTNPGSGFTQYTVPAAPPANAAPTAPAAPPMPEMLRWSYSLHASDISEPACAEDGSLLLTLDKSKLLALAPDGAERFTFKPAGGWREKLSPPAATDMVGAIAGLSSGAVLKLDGWGDEAWRYETQTAMLTRPVLDRHSMAYCTSQDGVVHCLTPQGTLAWKCDLGTACSKASPVLAAAGAVYQVTDGGAVALVYNGRAAWRKELALDASVPAVVDKGVLYGADGNGLLVAVSLKGEELWRTRVGRRLAGGICCAAGAVYAGNRDGGLYAFSSAGEPLWMVQLGGQPAGLRRRATDGRLYVWAQNGKFYAVSPEGKLLYSYDGDAAAQGIALGAGGLVYLISSGGLVALQD